ncbi:MAG: hypothetical protein SFU98_00550 [Leptospiraceae bacterium]|nr:hypothetical protein [Leptospiraceae bacterium]
MKLNLLLILLFTLNNCFIPIIKEMMDCEEKRDKMYPSAVSNCEQTAKEFDSKTDPAKEIKR